MNFNERVYHLLTLIPKGKVTTYGEIARALGSKRASRAVGRALHNNPDGEKHPCYKVVDRHGKLTYNFVFGGICVQRELLERDGIEVKNDTVDLNKYGFSFDDETL